MGSVPILCINVNVPIRDNLMQMQTSGFPLGLENLEKWEGIFQSMKGQGILNRL